jgi:hypothetical protein
MNPQLSSIYPKKGPATIVLENSTLVVALVPLPAIADLSRSRAVDGLVSKLPGMGRTRDVQMERITMLIRDNHRIMGVLEAAHELARARREEVRKALRETNCLALGVETWDS